MDFLVILEEARHVKVMVVTEKSSGQSLASGGDSNYQPHYRYLTRRA